MGWGLLAAKVTEKLKAEILAALPVDCSIELVDFLKEIGGNPQLLSGALQSLVMAGLVKVALVKEEASQTQRILLARAELADERTDWTFDPYRVKLNKKQINALLEYRKAQVLALLQDGQPRSWEEITTAVPGTGGVEPGSLAQLIKLPDQTYTLPDTSAGKAEMERRRAEKDAILAKLTFQEETLKTLLADGGAVTKAELVQALGGPVLPQIKVPLLRLSDGRYGLSDGAAARADAAAYLADRPPLPLEDFQRKFRENRELVTSLKLGLDQPPFIILPRGLVTTTETPYGQAEQNRRQAAHGLKERLMQVYGERPFFKLADLSLSPEQREAALELVRDEGCVRLKIGSQSWWCSPYPYLPERMARELSELLNKSFEFGGGPEITPVNFLANRSCSMDEAAKRIRLGVDDVINLSESGDIPTFRLGSSERVWTDDVQELRYRPDIHKMARRAEKLTVREAADTLSCTMEQVRRLTREGHLKPAGEYENNLGQVVMLVRRGDVTALRQRLPEIEEQWYLEAKKASRRAATKEAGLKSRREVTTAKRRPVRKDVPQPGERVFKLDDFQAQAIEAALAGKNVLVAAPTGTGKTVIAEGLIEAELKRGMGAVYTSPLKALSNQKFVDFRQRFGDDTVGLVTGDISINPYAPLLIMTTEIFRNRCFSEPEGLANIACVVFDEIHYLDDPERGTAWEESIIFAPPHIRFLGLSATVPNIQEIADWMGEVRGEPVTVVQELKRAVPLNIQWMTVDGTVLEEDEAQEYIGDLTRRQMEKKRLEKEERMMAKAAAQEEPYPEHSGRRRRRNGTRRR